MQSPETFQLPSASIMGVTVSMPERSFSKEVPNWTTT